MAHFPSKTFFFLLRGNATATKNQDMCLFSFNTFKSTAQTTGIPKNIFSFTLKLAQYFKVNAALGPPHISWSLHIWTQWTPESACIWPSSEGWFFQCWLFNLAGNLRCWGMFTFAKVSALKQYEKLKTKALALHVSSRRRKTWTHMA